MGPTLGLSIHGRHGASVLRDSLMEAKFERSFRSVSDRMREIRYAEFSFLFFSFYLEFMRVVGLSAKYQNPGRDFTVVSPYVIFFFPGVISQLHISFIYYISILVRWLIV